MTTAFGNVLFLIGTAQFPSLEEAMARIEKMVREGDVSLEAGVVIEQTHMPNHWHVVIRFPHAEIEKLAQAADRQATKQLN